MKAIISKQEALQILENDLRRLALEKHAAELMEASADKRAGIMAEIEREIKKEMRRRSWRAYPKPPLH